MVVELSHESEAFMIGVVTKAWHRHEGANVEVPYVGTVKRNDELVRASTCENLSGAAAGEVKISVHMNSATELRRSFRSSLMTAD